MKFSDIIGHNEEKRKLVAMVDSGKLPHALLLHGPSGVGKTNLARAFVQYIGCTDRRNGDSCGQCPSCLQTAKLNNPDIHYVYPVLKRANPSRSVSSDYSEEWEKFITDYPFMPPQKWLEIIDAGNSQPIIYVNESEEILRISNMSSYGDGYKIFIIWQADKMNPQAANKLLKVIEEPFSDTLFILVSNDPGELMPTIRSRLQSLELRQLSDAEIIEYLNRKGKTGEETLALAKLARGNMNRAAELIQNDGERAQFRSDFVGVMRACYARKMPELKNYADSFAKYGREKSLRLLDFFSSLIRESFISNLHCQALEAMTPDEKAFVDKFGPFINAANVEEISREIDRAHEDISRNGNQKIVWFDFMIELTRLIRTKGIT